ncbi:MAG TPA: SHOCT domain-containing protein [Candidatus Limnocylindria bacterium]
MQFRTWVSDLARWRGPALAISAASLFLAACSSVGGASITFWDVVWSMVIFFFWFMLIWIFISIFADIFRRNDLTGGWKAIWIILLVFLPFLGALIYIISRPKVTAQDVQMMTQADAAVKAANAVSPADQIAKLNELKASGAITVPEYEALKKKAMEG